MTQILSASLRLTIATHGTIRRNAMYARDKAKLLRQGHLKIEL